MASMWKVTLKGRDSGNGIVEQSYYLVRHWPDGGQVDAVNAMAHANGWSCTMTPARAEFELSELEERFKRCLV